MLITESCRITIPGSWYRCVITHKAGGDALWSVRCHPPDLMALSGMNERFKARKIIQDRYEILSRYPRSAYMEIIQDKMLSN
ncbi:hypothetical protein R3D40_001457 [Escherichia coli]|nr:hypothetical protein [Escherichia coli]